MIQPQLEIQLVGSLVAAACALPGTFLVLRRTSLMSDAISHAILLGIVLAFFLVQDLYSPWLIVGAALMGVITVFFIELVRQTELVKEDAAIGLVFPLLFSVGVILISRYAGNVHLDTDVVLLGELAFAPFDRLVVRGMDLGPKGAWVGGSILLLNVLFIGLFYKELKLATFDPALAASLGFSPALIHYLLMGVVSVTAVGAFNAVGAILVVALMIVPPATAYLLTDNLARMLGLSVGIGVVSAVAGYWVAHWWDASIAGSMATVSGLLFGVTVLVAPEYGLLARARRLARQRLQFAERLLVIHLLTHEGTAAEAHEAEIAALPEHLRWDSEFTRTVVRHALRDELVVRQNGTLAVTPKGREVAQESITRL